MANAQLLFLFHKCRVATRSGNAGKMRKICVQSEKTKKEVNVFQKIKGIMEDLSFVLFFQCYVFAYIYYDPTFN